MRLAWYVSLVAQFILVATLWEPGKRDWWQRYLSIALIVSLIRIQFSGHLSGHDYWYAWVATEPLLMGLQFLAVEQATRGTTRDLSHIALIMAVSFTLWAVLLTGDNWPLLRRASLLMKQAGTFGCFSVLLVPLFTMATRLKTDLWMLAYFTLGGLSLIAAQASATRSASEAVSTVHLSLIAILFAAWTACALREQFKQKAPAYVRNSGR